MNARLISCVEMKKIISTLEIAGQALSASHNLTVTDRSDMPLEEQPFYVLDHAKETNAIQDALISLGVVINTDSDHECDSDNSDL